IIMAAPDISAEEFRQRYADTLRKLSSQITLYASSRDRALMVSTSVHGHNRAGLAGDDICIVDGIDTIDVSHVDTSLIGHSYYGDNPALIDDLRALIQLAQTTSEREWLEQVKMASDKVYWKFR
ncbi:MAG: alpha/beta hydrolase, partial [Pirellulaceae bacterium]